MQLRDTIQGKFRWMLTVNTDSVYSIALVPDGTTLASSSDDGTVLLWKVHRFIDSIIHWSIGVLGFTVSVQRNLRTVGVGFPNPLSEAPSPLRNQEFRITER